MVFLDLGLSLTCLLPSKLINPWRQYFGICILGWVWDFWFHFIFIITNRVFFLGVSQCQVLGQHFLDIISFNLTLRNEQSTVI